MDRRAFLYESGAMGLALAMGASSCSSGNNIHRKNGRDVSARHLPRIKVSPDRIIKETVGLWPYRLSGPRLDVQQLGQKTIVHNYGHGGSGFALSWGTGQIAAANAAATGEQEMAVMGFGIVGLITARRLQAMGKHVTIYAKALFNDEELIPISGQLSFLMPQPEINYRLSTPHGYIIPRKDGLVLGGNAIRNNWNTTPDPKQTELMLAAVNEVVSHMRS